MSKLIKYKLGLVEHIITNTSDIWTDTINTRSFLGMREFTFWVGISKVYLDSVTIGTMELS